ncbi:RING-14 protein-like protein [Cucurbitaria berberidis CBS 394.84]|uniref:RING-14 protein-like protein n=1 Tax=Cucurbitaria berberidis CBS 394.84 TaxID=1168544 RepID=A0A9P4GD85_9PLEO|nr:RING-14 protein-like protein [Cucurbitaria berberidis CBS 394.84]KAF1843778.1 RING-14 protein-like protein [Cucurbitaria berberidis CBS 394.84]
MKFGRVFKQSLTNEGFPPEWVDSAISYSQLKKCINRLTDELQQVGLDPATLSKLLKHVEDYNASAEQHDDQERPFEYILNGDDPAETSSKARRLFHPKLLFYVNETTGEVHSARLDEETKRKLQMLAVETGMSEVRVTDESGPLDPPEIEHLDSPAESATPTHAPRNRPGYRTVEVPITSDTEFFTRLTSEVSGLEKLQTREEKRMGSQIEDLGKQIAIFTDPGRRANKKMLAAWRQIFQMYIEEGIFFGTTESDHKAHDSDKAMQRLAEFSTKVAQTGLVDQMRKKDNLKALTMFMHINREILQGLRFGEINHSAMLKILKKFDKRTALGVKSTFPRQVEYPEFSEHLAKAVCAEVNTQILSHIPQIDDYSCPMCFDLKWRPVKLSCGHTFCIRCLIVMQNKKQHNCPFCREPTVFDANSDNLDQELATFLKKWFPDEVKTKQRYNELMAGIDQYGEVYASQKCVLM